MTKKAFLVLKGFFVLCVSMSILLSPIVSSVAFADDTGEQELGKLATVDAQKLQELEKKWKDLKVKLDEIRAAYPPKVNAFDAQPRVVAPGGNVEVSWTVTNARKVEIFHKFDTTCTQEQLAGKENPCAWRKLRDIQRPASLPLSTTSSVEWKGVVTVALPKGTAASILGLHAIGILPDMQATEQTPITITKQQPANGDQLNAEAERMNTLTEESRSAVEKVLGDVRDKIEKKAIDPAKAIVQIDAMLQRIDVWYAQFDARVTAVLAKLVGDHPDYVALRTRIEAIRTEAKACRDQMKNLLTDLKTYLTGKTPEQVDRAVVKQKVDAILAAGKSCRDKIQKLVADLKNEFKGKIPKSVLDLGEHRKELEQLRKEVEAQRGEAMKSFEALKKKLRTDARFEELKKKIEARSGDALSRRDELKKLLDELKGKL